MPLPKGVERVRAKGRTYYYWNPHRGTDREGGRVKLEGDPFAAPATPEYIRFHRELARAASKDEEKIQPGTIAAMVRDYQDSEEFKGLSESTQKGYNVSLKRFAKQDTWGLFGPDQLNPAAVLAARDALKATPYMANEMLSVGRTLYKWGMPLGYATTNPFESIGPLSTPDAGHVPWPDWAIEHVIAAAPQDIVRLVKLGIMTCQRESDLVRMGPVHRQDCGIWCRPQKTKKRRRAFFIPLLTTEAAELDRWSTTAISFTAKRWKTPIARHNPDLYLYSPKGAKYNPSSLRARYNRWMRTEDGKKLRERWQEWLKEQIKKYEWEIDPEDWQQPTIHGLRGTGILARFDRGFSVEQIANDVGMSRQMVERYMRFRDQMGIAARGRARLSLVTPT